MGFSEQAKLEAIQTAPSIAAAALPDIPAQDAEICPDPGVKAGQPALSELANNRLALGACVRRHQRVVAFYHDIQSGHQANAENQINLEKR